MVIRFRSTWLWYDSIPRYYSSVSRGSHWHHRCILLMSQIVVQCNIFVWRTTVGLMGFIAWLQQLILCDVAQLIESPFNNMAGAKPGVHILKLEPNRVHESLVTGEKVIKWDEVGYNIADLWNFQSVIIGVMLLSLSTCQNSHLLKLFWTTYSLSAPVPFLLYIVYTADLDNVLYQFLLTCYRAIKPPAVQGYQNSIDEHLGFVGSSLAILRFMYFCKLATENTLEMTSGWSYSMDHFCGMAHSRQLPSWFTLPSINIGLCHTAKCHNKSWWALDTVVWLVSIHTAIVP